MFYDDWADQPISPDPCPYFLRYLGKDLSQDILSCVALILTFNSLIAL